MQLVVGGAYSGKRKLVKEKFPINQWYSAYQYQSLARWKEKYGANSPFVVEGWEVWIRQEWEEKQDLEPIRMYFESIIADMQVMENNREQPVVLVMMEVGRGIVPMDKNDRAWRDLCGWVLQCAAACSEEVHYCWHGLSRRLK